MSNNKNILINELCKLEENINKIKKITLKIQICKLGPITADNLEKINFTDNILINRLRNEENKNKRHEPIIKKYNEKKKLLDEKYNVKKKKNEILIKFNNDLRQIKKLHKINYDVLQKDLRDIEINRLRNVRINNNYKIKIDILLNDINVLKKHNLYLKNKINCIKKNGKSKRYMCGGNMEDILKKEKECEINENDIKIDEKVIEKCKKSLLMENMEKLKEKKDFLNKYYNSLKKFKETCENYGGKNNGIILEDILFTKEQVNNKINELITKFTEFEEFNYEINEKQKKEYYETDIKFIQEKYDILLKKQKEYNLYEMKVIRNIMEKYKKMERLRTREENDNFIDRLKAEKIELESKNEELEKIYLEKNRF